ncbi:hypothetical protein KJ359_009152 [Pestalotiopsis sp. 9143b]|nr:hypothetical protein KJ359_009152 [Pestalotiopsis sp. 9143b]
MRLPKILAAAASLLLSATLATAATPYSQQMAASIMSRGQGIMTGSGGTSELLQAGFTQKAFTALAAQYADDDADLADEVRAYVVRSAESVAPFVANATKDALEYPMDRLSNGNALLAFSESHPAGANLTAAAALRASIDLNRRNDEGGLWYFTYPYWSYLDGMYSLAPFYTLSALANAKNDTNATKAALDDVLLQLDLLWQHCRNETSGLLVHGYDASRTAVWADPATGASPHVWGRSLGWYLMALVDTLEILSSSSYSASTCSLLKSYARRVGDKFRSLAPAVAAAADPASGAWWQVLDEPGADGNYIESSGSAMFAYALLKGSRLGYLDGVNSSATNFADIGVRATDYLTSTFVVDNGNGTLGYNGTVSVCSLNSTASYEYYVGQPINYNSVLGSAAYVLASLEVERLSQ